jgi:hypothetical protein
MEQVKSKPVKAVIRILTLASKGATPLEGDAATGVPALPALDAEAKGDAAAASAASAASADEKTGDAEDGTDGAGSPRTSSARISSRRGARAAAQAAAETYAAEKAEAERKRDGAQRLLLATQQRRARIVALLGRWRETDITITDAVNEAKDNHRNLLILRKPLQILYDGTPMQIYDSLPTLIGQIKVVNTIARYYSTPERMTTLFKKVTNQIIICLRNSLLAVRPAEGGEYSARVRDILFAAEHKPGDFGASALGGDGTAPPSRRGSKDLSAAGAGSGADGAGAALPHQAAGEGSLGALASWRPCEELRGGARVQQACRVIRPIQLRRMLQRRLRLHLLFRLSRFS